MKKNDWLLAAGITGLALMILAFQILTGKTEHAQVIVSIDGNPYGTYDLNTDQTVNINESNQIRIQDRTVRMTEADCPDKLCVHQTSIRHNGESLVCLPHKVIVKVTANASEDDLDGVAK